MLVLLLLLVTSSDCHKVPPGKKIKVTFKQETDVSELVAWASALSCKTILLPKALQDRKVMVSAPDTMTADQGWPLFLAALNSVGLTVLPSGDALVVSETLRAKEAAPVRSDADALPRDDRYVTQLLKLEHAMPSEASQVLEKLRSKDAQLIAHDPSGTLILMDTAANVRRMVELARKFDVAGPNESLWIIPVRSGNVTALAERMGQVFALQAAPGKTSAASPPPSAGPRFIPDEGTRSVLVVATESIYQRALALVRKLEQTREANSDDEDGWVHLVALEHANADEMAATLGVLGGISVTAAPAAAKPASGGSIAGGPPASPKPPSLPSTPSPASSASSSPSTLFSGDVRVIPDRPSNSLVVLASAQDFLQLRGLIRRLDVARRQVLIEATILEVSLDHTRNLDISFHGGDLTGSGNTIVAGSNAGGTPGVVPSPDAARSALADLAQGLAVGIIGHPFEALPGVSVPSFGAFLHALATSSDVHILSTPHLLTMDNEPANIVVGKNLPFPGATAPALGSGTTTLVQGYIPVERKDVALTLQITPQINQGGSVRLHVMQEVSDVLEQNYNQIGPSTSKKHLETTVEVDNEQPIVLGGLITERLETGENKVPVLGDIPLLGWFFKSQTKHTAKSNLLIFLVPYVIRDRADLRRIYERKDRESREFTERQSAFRNARDLHAQIDYRTKRGLLVAIDRATREFDEDEALRTRLSQRRQAEAGPIEPPSRVAGVGADGAAATGTDSQAPP
jgi:general secretion pathway protein D